MVRTQFGEILNEISVYCHHNLREFSQNFQEISKTFLKENSCVAFLAGTVDWPPLASVLVFKSKWFLEGHWKRKYFKMIWEVISVFSLPYEWISPTVQGEEDITNILAFKEKFPHQDYLHVGHHDILGDFQGW